MVEVVKLGSLYFDGQPQEIGVPYNGKRLLFGDTVSGKEISWARLQNGLLIAGRCVCTEISWEQLHEEGFVFGAPITIDGETYLCRCLRVGAKKGEPNEWDAALDEAEEDNDLWHWKKMFFWGQDLSKYNSLTRAVRGYGSARSWSDRYARSRHADVGFRPALEHLGSEPCSLNALLGNKTKVYCSDGITIESCLVDFSDYDVVLKASSSMPVDCSWAIKDGNNIIVSRGDIIWLKEG